MIRELTPRNANTIYGIINNAARAYKGVIPPDCYREECMTKEGLFHEMESVTFFGWEEGKKLVGVMGFQPVKDVTLIRHAYVLTEYQRKGIGTKLLNHIKQMVKTKKLLVGTWSDAIWAIQFHQNHGFRLTPEKDELLRKYWNIPQRQIETSIVLGIEM